MMNRLRNSARPASTWFGGIVGVPSAFRVSDSTTITLVNAVHSTSRAGAIDRTVSSRMMLTVWLGLAHAGVEVHRDRARALRRPGGADGRRSRGRCRVRGAGSRRYGGCCCRYGARSGDRGYGGRCEHVGRAGVRHPGVREPGVRRLGVRHPGDRRRRGRRCRRGLRRPCADQQREQGCEQQRMDDPAQGVSHDGWSTPAASPREHPRRRLPVRRDRVPWHRAPERPERPERPGHRPVGRR